MGKALGDDIPLYSELLPARSAAATETIELGNILCSASSELNEGAKFWRRLSRKALAYSCARQASRRAGCFPMASVVAGSGLRRPPGAGCGHGDTSYLCVHCYNLRVTFRTSLIPTCGAEGGLLLCTWPKGGQLSLPFPVLQ